MEETQAAVPGKKSKEERSKIAKEAAQRRWAKAKRAKKTASSKRSKLPKHKATINRREFSSALKAAEKRLEKAIQERAEAAGKYNILNSEIPSLVAIIAALKGNHSAPPSEYGQQVTLETIVSDQPLGYQNPPRVPVIPVPPAQHPVNSAGRAQGGAVGVQLVEDDDENKFLRESGVAGGEWH